MSKTRIHVFTTRLSNDEKASLTNAHLASGYAGTLSSYARDLLIGRIKHVSFEDDVMDIFTQSVPNTGFVNAGYEQRIHYEAVMIAANIIRIKSDPELQKFIKGNRDIFNQLVDGIRGYSYDEKTKERRPLNLSENS